MSASTSATINLAQNSREFIDPQIETIIDTPEKVILKCSIQESDHLLPLYELGKGIAENYKTENDIQAHSITIYFYLQPHSEKSELHISSERKNWSDLFNSMNPSTKKEVYLDVFTYQFQPPHLLENTLPQGFIESKILSTTPIFVAVNIGDLPASLVNELIQGFSCCYNTNILLVSCQISIQEEIINKLQSYGLEETKDFKLVNIFKQGIKPSSLVGELPWLRYYTSKDNRTVCVYC